MSGSERAADGTRSHPDHADLHAGDFERLLGSHPDGILVVDHEGVVAYANNSAERHLNPREGILVGLPLGLPLADADQTTEIEVPTAAGSYRILLIGTTPIWWRGDQAFLVTTRDVTTPASQIQDLRRDNERFSLAMRGSNDGLWDWDIRTGNLHVNERWLELVGLEHLPQDDHDASLWLDRTHDADRPHLLEMLDEHLRGTTDLLSVEHRVRHHSGEYVWMHTRGRAVFDHHGEAVRIAGSLTNITTRKELEERLRHEAHHDPLTGLANRRLLIERIGITIARATRSGSHYAVALLDLDGFKQINDTHGHDAGDAVLIEVGSRLQQCLRPSDLAARLGGDEFAILFDDVEPSALSTVGNRILRELAPPHRHAGTELIVGASIGIARPSAEATVGSLLRVADEAMYEAKTRDHAVVLDA